MQVVLPREKIICDNFVNGGWLKGEAGTFKCHSPYNGQLIGEVSIPSHAQIQNAIAAAAQKQPAWGKTPPPVE